MKRYMLHPGWMSWRVGPAEWISASDLVQLYGVRPGECLVESPEMLRRMDSATFARLIHLYPDSSGRYQLSQAPAEQPPLAQG